MNWLKWKPMAGSTGTRIILPVWDNWIIIVQAVILLLLRYLLSKLFIFHLTSLICYYLIKLSHLKSELLLSLRVIHSNYFPFPDKFTNLPIFIVVWWWLTIFMTNQSSWSIMFHWKLRPLVTIRIDFLKNCIYRVALSLCKVKLEWGPSSTIS